jgi:hypothetical protein
MSVLIHFSHQVGIAHQFSCPHTHQQNGAVEYKHCHIIEMGLALLAYASMPLKYWDKAFLAAVYLINRTPTEFLSYDTPLHHLLGATPPPIIPIFMFFGASVGPIYVCIIPTSFIFDLLDASFLGTVICTRDSSASMYPQDISIFLVTWFLMNLSFLLRPSIPMPVPVIMMILS